MTEFMVILEIDPPYLVTLLVVTGLTHRSKALRRGGLRACEREPGRQLPAAAPAIRARPQAPGRAFFAVFQGTSNGGHRCANLALE